MMNSMEQFRDIIKQTNVEMERELERMPIGKFQWVALIVKARLLIALDFLVLTLDFRVKTRTLERFWKNRENTRF